MTMMMLHQLLKPALLLVLLFVVNLPSSWSLCDIVAARRDAYAGKCKKINPSRDSVIDLAKRAADKADVLSPTVLEAYKKGVVKEDGYKTCVLFSAWTNKCIGYFQHCVASLDKQYNIEVNCTTVARAEAANFKSGGFAYYSREGNGQFTEMLVGDKLNSTTSKRAVVAVPCRAGNNVAPGLSPFCVSCYAPNNNVVGSICISVVDAEKPDWYLRHHNGYLDFEFEPAARSPETFDADASFVQKQIGRAFVALESSNKRRRYISSPASGNRVSLNSFRRPEDSKEANLYIVPSYTKEQFPCSSCDEIQSLDRRARSGYYVITADDGKSLQEAYCEMTKDEEILE